jgi:Transposase DDE domain
MLLLIRNLKGKCELKLTELNKSIPNRLLTQYPSDTVSNIVTRTNNFFFLLKVKCRKAIVNIPYLLGWQKKYLTIRAFITFSLITFSLGKILSHQWAVKLHLLLNYDVYLLTYVYRSNGKKYDVTVARKVLLAPGSIIAMDRVYNDYKLYAQWANNNICFVTRLKDNADFIVIAEQKVSKNRNILSDQFIIFSGYYSNKDCPHVLRRVVVWDKEKDKESVLLTNHLDFGVTTISDIYKGRWQSEIFFKALKQTLKVKTFVGTSDNAIYIQIWTALIAMLLIKYLQFKSKRPLKNGNFCSSSSKAKISTTGIY